MNKEKELILEELRTKKDKLQEKAQEDIVIQNIKFLGQVELKEKIVEDGEKEGKDKTGNLYLVEEYNTKTDEVILKYYVDDRFVGINMNGEFLPTGFGRDSYENLDSIKDILENLNEKEEKQKKNNKNPEEERKVYDLNELEKEKEKEETYKEKKEVKDDNKEGIVENKKISNIKGEIDLDQQINGETLRKILGLGEEYDAIAPVRASTIGVASNSEYCFVAIKNDKTCTVIGKDLIEEDRQKGTNPDEKDIMIENDGDVVKESSLANFRINNRPNFVMTVRYDENSTTKETTISDISGRKSRKEEVAQELEKEGDGWIDGDARNTLRKEGGIEESDEMQKRQEEHEKLGCENDKVENIDDDMTNDTHVHIVITKDTEVPGKEGMTVEQWASELGESTEVIIKRLQREIDEKRNKPLDIVEEIENDYERVSREQSH